MNESLQEFLRKLSGIECMIFDAGYVDNDTRKGNYWKVKNGLSYAVYFVGEDLTTGQVIVEDTGQ
jgi:hypothetical protein